jgi:hypothetical protein
VNISVVCCSIVRHFTHAYYAEFSVLKSSGKISARFSSVKSPITALIIFRNLGKVKIVDNIFLQVECYG